MVDGHGGHKRARHPQRKRPRVEGHCPRAAMDGQAADAAVVAALVDEAVRADSDVYKRQIRISIQLLHSGLFPLQQAPKRDMMRTNDGCERV